MAVPIHIPKLGFTMTEAKLVEWKAKEGDWIEKGDIVLIIETEKVSFEVEADTSGFLHILAEAGSVLQVGEVAGMLAKTEEELGKLQSKLFQVARSAEENIEAIVADKVQKMPDINASLVKISPVAKKMAAEHQIDITKIKGSGPGGRIIKNDIEKAIGAKQREAVTTNEVAPTEVREDKKVKATILLQGMRKTIAEHMQKSLLTSAQVTTMGEIDMTEMVKLRNSLVEKEEEFGLRMTYTDIYVFVIAKVLKENPIINSSVINDEIKIWEDINIGIAIAIEINDYESGLIVPVVRNADRKSLLEISKAIKELADKAKRMQLMPDDISGGTFTLTNMGGYGVGWTLSTPIINQPQSAILNTAGIMEKPVVKDGQITISPIMSYSLTYDHRVIDGLPAWKFRSRFKELIENPSLLLA